MSSDRKVIAVRDYQPGDAVVPQELPVVHVLHQAFKFKYCDECFSKSQTLKKCNGCGLMSYCSRRCRVKNWEGGHKWECPVFKKAAAAASGSRSVDFFGEDGDLYRFVLRAWLLFKAADSKLHTTEGTLLTGEKWRFADLKPNAELLKKNRNVMNEFSRELVPLFKRYDLITDCEFKDFFDVRCKLRTNGFAGSPLFGDNEETLASCLYLASSAFNHSCQPNASRLCDGDRNTLKVIAVTPIKQGDEICISYTGPFMTTEERRVLLERIYCFTCQCELCTSVAASKELTRKEVIRLQLIAELTMQSCDWEVRKMVSSNRAEADSEILRLKIAIYELVRSFVPAAEPHLVYTMLQISKLIIKRMFQSPATSQEPRRVTAQEGGGDVRPSQWTDDEWLTQTERYLAMMVGRDYPEYVDFKTSLSRYNEDKLAGKLMSGLSI